MPSPVRSQRVIPLGTDLVPLETETRPFVRADTLAGLIAAALEVYCQPWTAEVRARCAITCSF